MRSNASKINQLKNDNCGFATMMANPVAPYVIMAATKTDVVRLVAHFEKIEMDEVDMKKIYRVKITKDESKRRKAK